VVPKHKNQENKLNLEDYDVRYSIEWYNPRSGEGLLKGSILSLKGPGWQDLGEPPYEIEDDWVILVKSK